MNRDQRIAALKKALSERILLIDGAMGTMIQAQNLTAQDFGGPELEGCNENLVLSKPEAIEAIHRHYLEAGADIIETDTFGGTPLVLAEYGLSEKTVEINRRAAEIARSAAEAGSTADRPRFVAGSMGPTTKAISVTGGVAFQELQDHYSQQAEGLLLGGADFLLLETAQDTRNVKAGIFGCEAAFAKTGLRTPIAVSCTIEPTGTMLAGQSVEAFWTSVAHINPLYIGLNCATGPEFMTDHIRSLAKLAPVPVACVPNAGLPDESGNYLENPDMMATVLERFVREGWVNLIGGCCGTTHRHIARFRRLADQHRPRTWKPRKGSYLSGIEFLEVDDEKRPVLVGERTNVIGSRKFKELVVSQDFEAAAEVARGQVKHGAQVIDICLANPDRDERSDMENFLKHAVRLIRAPFMIDSTDEAVINLALTYSQGKAIINSINLEDGEDRFQKVLPLAKKYGAAVVVGTIDDDPTQGMAITRDRKLAVARRSYDLLTKKYEIPPEDIYWDALVFPCATGDQQYVGSAVETIEGLRLIKTAFPNTKSVLGISNVSFGLPTQGREVLNSVFLYHCTHAGLDMAIVNSELLKRYPSIPPEERALAEDLLFNRSPDAISTFADYFRKKKPAKTTPVAALPLEERLRSYIIDGTKEGLIPDLEEARKKSDPLAIINGPLMAGMDEVGRLFAQNELIVAEVLQSAEVMKAAVNHLEKFMTKAAQAIRGKVVLATVKGDVHDIGKNLVEIILSNNGFEVVNLGIKVPPEQLISAVKEHQPQIIGLSGLLVKSAQQMVSTAEDLSKAGISVPMLVGGAALSRSFTDRRIAKAYGGGTVAYASNAMNGLELAKILVEPEKFARLKEDLAKTQSIPADASEVSSSDPEVTTPARSTVQLIAQPPAPPDLERHVLTTTPLEHIWSYINPRMLYGRHLGIPNSLIRLIEERKAEELTETSAGQKAHEISQVIDQVKHEVIKSKLLQPKAVYQFYRAHSQGDSIVFQDPDGRPLGGFKFPRKKVSPFLCLADYLPPPAGKPDHLGLFVVTAGTGVRAKSEEWKNSGDYLKSHVLAALALETAEAYAELLHAKIRGLWGNPDAPEMTMMDRFQAKYTGRRYSFGYPACPDLEGQRELFRLLRPEEIGVTLTEGFMMDPEASVSALVFHHPEATYFAI